MTLEIKTYLSIRAQLLKQGVYDTIIKDVKEETHYNPFTHVVEWKVSVVFEIIHAWDEKNSKIVGRKIKYNFTPFITTNSNLSKFIYATLGRELSGSEVALINELNDIRSIVIDKKVAILILNKCRSVTKEEYSLIYDWFPESNFPGEIEKGIPVSPKKQYKISRPAKTEEAPLDPQ